MNRYRVLRGTRKPLYKHTNRTSGQLPELLPELPEFPQKLPELPEPKNRLSTGGARALAGIAGIMTCLPTRE
jgi:hypothetical protein